jgi:hypothetical protein
MISVSELAIVQTATGLSQVLSVHHDLLNGTPNGRLRKLRPTLSRRRSSRRKERHEDTGNMEGWGMDFVAVREDCSPLQPVRGLKSLGRGDQPSKVKNLASPVNGKSYAHRLHRRRTSF